MRFSQLISPLIPSFLLSLHLHLASAASDLPALPDTTGANAPAEATSKVSKTAAASKTTEASKSTASASNAKASSLPTLTTDSSDLGGLQTGLPKLAGEDYPAPSVPPTSDAPYMQKSNLPEGTVFICVGAALALIALVILAWRGIVAWSLHRSVRRSAMAQSSKYTYIGDGKSSTRGPTSRLGSKLASPFAGSTHTLDAYPPNSTTVTGGGKGAKSSSGPASRNSLFFSPTASHTTASNVTPATSNRASAYLPAGYYVSNAPSHQPQQPGISMSNLRPDSSAGAANNRYSRYSRSIEPSPPPSSRGTEGRPSTGGGGLLSLGGLGAGLNLSTTALTGGASGGGSEGRAPSAYLEDLFESGATAAAAVAEPPKQEREKEREREREREPSKQVVEKERERDGVRRGQASESRREDEGRREGKKEEEEAKREHSSRRRRRRSSHGMEPSGDGRRRESAHGVETAGGRRRSSHGMEPSEDRRRRRSSHGVDPAGGGRRRESSHGMDTAGGGRTRESTHPIDPASGRRRESRTAESPHQHHPHPHHHHQRRNKVERSGDERRRSGY